MPHHSTSDNQHHRNAHQRVHLKLLKLLQLSVLRHHQQTVAGSQNAAMRVLTGTWRRDHIRFSPILHCLHWLLITRRTEYKLVMLMHRAQGGQLPPVPCRQLQTDGDFKRPRSSFIKYLDVCNNSHQNKFFFSETEFPCSWTNSSEQSSSWNVLFTRD